MNGNAASGKSFRQIGGNCATVTTIISRQIIIKINASDFEIIPRTIIRFFIRGCNLSNFKSARLSIANAAARPEVTANAIKKSVQPLTVPFDAINAAINANGKSKIVCESAMLLMWALIVAKKFPPIRSPQTLPKVRARFSKLKFRHILDKKNCNAPL